MKHQEAPAKEFRRRALALFCAIVMLFSLLDGLWGSVLVSDAYAVEGEEVTDNQGENQNDDKQLPEGGTETPSGQNDQKDQTPAVTEEAKTAEIKMQSGDETVSIKKDQEIAVKSGETFSLTMVLEAGEQESDFSFQWNHVLSDGTNEAIKNGTKATLENLKMGADYDGWKIVCVATNKETGATRQTYAVTLKLQAEETAPVETTPAEVPVDETDDTIQIKESPEAYTGLLTTVAAFQVNALSTKGADLEYQWEYKAPQAQEWTALADKTVKVDGQDQIQVAGAKTAELKVQITDELDGKEFRCVINTKGSTATNKSSAAKLTAIKITKQPVDTVTKVNQPVKFNCEIAKTSEKISVSWFIYKIKDPVWRELSGAKGKFDPTMKASANRDGALIKCVLKDQSGQTLESNTVTLYVVSGLELSCSDAKKLTVSKTLTLSPVSGEFAKKDGLKYYIGASDKPLTNAAQVMEKATEVTNGTLEIKQGGTWYGYAVADGMVVASKVMSVDDNYFVSAPDLNVGTTDSVWAESKKLPISLENGKYSSADLYISETEQKTLEDVKKLTPVKEGMTAKDNSFEYVLESKDQYVASKTLYIYAVAEGELLVSAQATVMNYGGKLATLEAQYAPYVPTDDDGIDPVDGWNRAAKITGTVDNPTGEPCKLYISMSEDMDSKSELSVHADGSFSYEISQQESAQKNPVFFLQLVHTDKGVTDDPVAVAVTKLDMFVPSLVSSPEFVDTKNEDNRDTVEKILDGFVDFFDAVAKFFTGQWDEIQPPDHRVSVRVVTFEVTDAESGIQKVVCFAKDPEGNTKAYDMTAEKVDDHWAVIVTIPLADIDPNADMEYRIYDNAGNCKIVNKDTNPDMVVPIDSDIVPIVSDPDVWKQKKTITVNVTPNNKDHQITVTLLAPNGNKMAEQSGFAQAVKSTVGEGDEAHEVTTYVATFTFEVSDPGTNKYTVIAREGYSRKTANVMVEKIDTKAPEVTLDPAEDFFFNAEGASITVSGVDNNSEGHDNSASGIQTYYYSVDGGAAVSSTEAPVIKCDNKTATYTVWAVDQAGNKSDEMTIIAKYDNTRPVVTSVQFEGKDPLNLFPSATYAKETVKLTVSTMDPTVQNEDTSGVAKIEAFAVPNDLAESLKNEMDPGKCQEIFSEADSNIITDLGVSEKDYASFELDAKTFETAARDAKSIVLRVTDNAGNVRVTLIDEVSKDDSVQSSKLVILSKGALQWNLALNHTSDQNRAEVNGVVYYGKNTTITPNFQVQDQQAGLQSVELVAPPVKGSDASNVVLFQANYAENKGLTTPVESAPRSEDGEIKTISTADYDEGDCKLSITAKNNLNEALTDSASFVIDKTAPEVTSFKFVIEDPANLSPANYNGDDKNDPQDGVNASVGSDDADAVKVMSYGFFFKQATKVEVELTDAASGVASVQYYLRDKDGKVVSEGVLPADFSDASALKQNDPANRKVVATFTVPKDFKGQIFVRGIDRVNNDGEYAQPTRRTIIETAAHHQDEVNNNNAGVSIALPATGNTTETGVKLYADETLASNPIKITLRDFHAGIDLERSTVEIKPDAAFGKADGAVSYKAADLMSTAEGVVTDADKNNKGDKDLIVEATLVIPVQGIENNRVDVLVNLVDNVGNTTPGTAEFAIDKTAPLVKVNVTQNGQDEARNGKYFNVDRTATITVSDWNFESGTITTTGKIGSWSAPTMVDGVPTRTATVVYDVDGDYKLEVSAQDRAGHVTGNDKVQYTGSAPTEFTVDKTKPVIAITFDNNNVRNGKYYNAARTATVTITEHNFSSTVAGYSPVVVPTAKIAEGSVSVPGVNGWGGSGDTHTATVRFAQDGDFTLTADYTDLAGNKAEQVKISEFTVDTTKPTLQITGVTANTAYSGDVAPSITYHDINYDSNSAGITIKGVAHSETSNLNGVRTTNAYGGSFTTPNIQVIKSNDDVYTITGTISDLAGNTTTESLTFSVNRFGSTYAFDEPTEKFLQNFFAQEPQDVVIREINVDSLKEYSIVVTRNGESTTLVEGKDYTVKTAGTGWKEYAYTIKASVFDKEGPYDIVVTSTDAAGNVNSNRTVKANGGVVDVVPVNFIIDKTSPTVVIDGVEEGGRYMSDTREVLIRIDDNVNVVLLEVFVDGVKVAEYDAEALEQFANGEIPFTVEAKNSNQTLMVIATDAAGNTTTYKDADGNEENVDVTFLLTSNLLVQYIHNGWALGGTAAAAALIFFLLFKRKKDDDEEEAANQA